MEQTSLKILNDTKTKLSDIIIELNKIPENEYPNNLPLKKDIISLIDSIKIMPLLKDIKLTVDIEIFKIIFEDYPLLDKLPIFSWGRYYKYELAGDPFSLSLCNIGFSGFLTYLSDKNKNKFDKEILSQIDNEYNNTDKYIDIIEEASFIDREECVKKFNFDGQGGKMLIITIQDEKLDIDCINCDSPE